MNYTIATLSSIADCDALLALVSVERQALNLKQAILMADLQSYSATSVNVETEIIMLTAEIAALDSFTASLPESKQKNKSITRRKVAEGRLSGLLDRVGNYGLVALINRQLDGGQIEAQIAAVDDFITQVETHTTTL